MTNTENTTAADLMTRTAAILTESANGWASGATEAQDAVQALKVAALALEHAQHALVAECRANGWTWTEIGQWLEISRQAAQQRFGN